MLTLNENDKVSISLHLRYQITLDMLKEVFEYNKAKENIKTRMDTMLPQMVEELNRMQDNKPMYMHYNLDTRARLEHFFAQCYVEVGGSAFRLEEGMNYTTAERLRQVFPNKFKDNKAKADELVAFKIDRAKAIANYVYANSNGNKGGDDGYNFRGRGIIQLTGRSNYTSFQSYYNKHNPNNTKDFLNNEGHRKELTTNGKMALLSAVYYWNDRKCNPKAKDYPELLILKGNISIK